MCGITKKTIENLAEVAFLRLSEEEKENFLENLTNIIAYIDVLHSISYEPNPSEDLPSVKFEDLREDIEETSWSREQFFENASEHAAGLIKVPTVIK